MNRGEVLVLGNGPSAAKIDWSRWRHTPVAAVSSGILRCKWHPAYFITYDRPTFYPQERIEPVEVQKHVPSGKGLFWLNYNNIVHWVMDLEASVPVFDGRDKRRMRGVDGKQTMPITFLAGGASDIPDSLLMAVQVLGLMGYTKLLFAGCDLLEESHAPVADVLRLWQPMARAAGIVWENMSKGSALEAFMSTTPELFPV